MKISLSLSVLVLHFVLTSHIPNTSLKMSSEIIVTGRLCSKLHNYTPVDSRRWGRDLVFRPFMILRDTQAQSANFGPAAGTQTCHTHTHIHTCTPNTVAHQHTRTHIRKHTHSLTRLTHAHFTQINTHLIMRPHCTLIVAHHTSRRDLHTFTRAPSFTKEHLFEDFPLLSIIDSLV